MEDREWRKENGGSSPLIIHTECSKGWGGQEIRILEELRGMRQYGLSTALAAPKESQIFQRAETEGFAVWPVKFASNADISSFVSLLRLIGRLHPTVVNTHSSKDSWIAGCAARVMKVPLVIRTRHVSTPIGSTFSYRHFPHLILTTSAAIRENLMQQGLDGRKIIPVPTGIDLKRFRFSAENRHRIRKHFSLSEKDVLVGNICVLRSWKGLDFFIETATNMADHFKFILVGDGPQKERLQDKARQAGLEDRLFFTGHQENVERFFSALDIFFFTSYASEGVPQSLLQALSVGLPLVVCRTPSVLETLRSVEGFTSVEYGDLGAARQAMEQISETLRTNENRIIYARRSVLSRYELENMHRLILDIYQQNRVIFRQAPPQGSGWHRVMKRRPGFFPEWDGSPPAKKSRVSFNRF